jgi:phosphoenolpyruvate synthase/pyruvate phosphate dikinase
MASGPVLVLRSPEEFGAMIEGSVLVCPMTTPRWLPVMHKAAAIVTDVGGRTSHAAIVCRELGIPAVVGTGDATERLAPAQRVAVNGSEGHVYG